MPKLTNEKLLIQAKRDIKHSQDFHAPWRADAREDFGFLAGGAGENSGQWDDDHIAELEEEGRVAVTFNRIEPMIEGIKGTEVNNRLEISYQPREPDDSGVTDALNEVSKWARDTDLEEEDTEAFGNALTCGIGLTVPRMEYDEDPDGRFVQVSHDPLAFRWDPKASRPNLTDTRWRALLTEFEEEDFKAAFPGKEGRSHVFGIKVDDLERKDPKDRDAEPYRDGNEQGRDDGAVKSKMVAEYQYWKREPMIRFRDPTSDKLRMVTPSEFKDIGKKAEALARQFQSDAFQLGAQGLFDESRDAERDAQAARQMIATAVKQTQKMFYRAFFSGDDEVLSHEVNVWPKGFTLQPITARFDRNRRMWYGLVRPMKDPQRYANKFRSGFIEVWLHSMKGGVAFEDDAVENPDGVDKILAKPGTSLKLLPGGLGKFMQLQPAQIPAILDRLLVDADNAPPNVTGINPEFLGLAGRDQPIGLEQTRKLATLTIAASLFSSYRKYRKNNGRLLLYFMRELFDLDTMMRVVSQGNRQFVPMIKDADIARFDVHVDEAPLSPSMKATVFSVMKDMLQFLPPELVQVVLPEFLNFSPLPATLVQKVNQALEAAKQPDPQAQALAQLQMQDLAAEVAVKVTKALLQQRKAEKTEEETSEIAPKAELDEILAVSQIQVEAADAASKNAAAADNSNRSTP